jgi:hypothetical protein
MYWNKPGAGFDQFVADHRICARESATPMPRSPDYGMVEKNMFRACMRAHGWRREEVMDAAASAEGGWFRGIEDEEVVRLDMIPDQPGPHPATAPTRPTAPAVAPVPAPTPVAPAHDDERAKKEAYCRSLWPNYPSQFEICMRQ